MNIICRSHFVRPLHSSYSFSKLFNRQLKSVCVRSQSNLKYQKFLYPFTKRNLWTTNFLCDVKIVQTPTFADSVSEGDIKWNKAVGDEVEIDEVIGEIETDKTAMPIHAPVSGVIEEILVEDGSTVVACQDIIKIKEGAVGAKASKPVEKVSETTTEKVPEPTPPPPPSPSTSALQNEKLIREVAPPSDGSLRLDKMETKKAEGDAGVKFILGSRGEQRVKMNRMRLRIAQRLKDAQNTCAMLTTFNECDMTEVISMRKKYQEAFTKKHGVKLGFMSAFIKAAAVALTDQPVVNAVIDGTDIIYRDYIDVSVAVSTPKGLVVPILRDVHRMGLADIELGVADLGERARKGILAVEDMDGGTFTISNGGVFGSLLGTPIINPPQSAILGIHATQMRPVAMPDGVTVAVRPMMYLALTYDHRLVDGREAVTFLRKIKAFIEDPRLVLVQL